MPMKLQKKFILIFVLISMIPITLFSFYTYSRYTSLVKRQTTQTAQHLLNVAAAHINYTLDDLEHIVETMYLTQENGDSMIDDLKKYSGNHIVSSYEKYLSNEKLKYTCQDFIYFSNYINGIFIFTPNGTTLGYGYGNGANIRTDYNPKKDDWYQKTLELQGGTYIFGPSSKEFISRSSSSISFCNALYDVYSKEFLGVLFIDCKPSIFDLDAFNSLPGTAFLSVKNQDAVLYQTDTAHMDISSLQLSEDLSLSGLSLLVDLNEQNLANEFQVTQNTLVALSLTCIAGILILSIFLSKSIISPIVHLSDQMLKRDGNQSVTNSRYFRYNDEIGTLYTSYQEMLDERNYYVKHELENKLIVLDSQMRALETQINAHFLYNTLESINSIAIKEKVPDISTMALSLGSMFRYSIKTKSELVPLSAELKNVNDYTSIQLLRHNHAFELITQIPEKLLSRKVLKLILQPLVENALIHGIDTSQPGGKITLTAEIFDAFLLLKVQDNGSGITSEKLSELQQELKQKAEFTKLGKRKNTSIGLANINTRIALYYGESYGLQIDSSPGKGTCIMLHLPVIT